VFLVPEKELHYFDRDFALGDDWYRSCFADARPDQLAGEATPRYLYSDVGLDRMHALVPKARLVVVLREPVARAWSNFQFWRSLGGDTRSFRTVVTRPDSRGVDYLGMSDYLPRLEAVTKRFGHETLQVLFFEEMIKDPQGAAEAVWRHVGLKSTATVKTVHHLNRTWQVRWPRLQSALRMAGAWRWPGGVGQRLLRLNTKPVADKLDHDLEALLRDRFHDHNVRLADWLGRELPPNWS